MSKRIVSIGGGNMGRAIIGGLLAKGHAKDSITVVDPSPEARALVAREFDVAVVAETTTLNDAEIVLLAVKPQIMHNVVRALAGSRGGARPLFISIAAGITTSQLAEWLGGDVPIVRVMPNTPALVGCGAAALFATQAVAAAEREAAESILNAVGIAVWVDDESLLDVVTAVSGSGPAYFFLIMEILEKIAVELGLESAIARRLSVETARGAAELARESASSPGTLREQVTSPGGTTERALEVLGAGGIEDLFRAALGAAEQRSRELARAAGGQ